MLPALHPKKLTQENTFGFENQFFGADEQVPGKGHSD
jgi:hypothetical protein